MNEAVGIEHGVLIRPVFRARLHGRGHERSLPREAPPWKDDGALLYPNNSSVHEHMAGSVQRDVHAQLGVEDAERQSQANRARDRLSVAHDAQKRLIRILDEREAATLGLVPRRTGARR